MTRARDIANFGDGIATADIDDGAVTAAKIGSLPAGSVLQVVQGTSTTETTVTATSNTDSGLSASITPTSATSKILILITQPIYVKRLSAANWQGSAQIVRDSTAIWSPSAYTLGFNMVVSSTDAQTRTYMTLNYLDSPSTTSSVTYKTQVRADSSGSVITQSNGDPSQIILMEIAG